MNKRPLSVTIISYFFIAAGIVGLVYHASEFNSQAPFDFDFAVILFLRILAVVGGVFTLRGANWARWLLVVWIAYHVYLSVFHSMSELVTHGVLLVVVAYFLFHRRASAHFHGGR